MKRKCNRKSLMNSKKKEREKKTLKVTKMAQNYFL